jgi:hypothetical protein
MTDILLLQQGPIELLFSLKSFRRHIVKWTLAVILGSLNQDPYCNLHV